MPADSTIPWVPNKPQAQASDATIPPPANTEARESSKEIAEEKEILQKKRLVLGFFIAAKENNFLPSLEPNAKGHYLLWRHRDLSLGTDLVFVDLCFHL